MVQRKAVRFIYNSYNSSTLPYIMTLEKRRKIARLKFLFPLSHINSILIQNFTYSPVYLAVVDIPTSTR